MKILGLTQKGKLFGSRSELIIRPNTVNTKGLMWMGVGGGITENDF